ncbi:MAG: alpha-2-macroglobulin family protein, partial [bacterium]
MASLPRVFPVASGALVLLSSCGEHVTDFAALDPDEVAVTSVQPSDGKLSQGEPIRITFSQDLLPEGGMLHVPLDAPPARLDPPVGGTWKWSQGSVLEFVPDEDYRPATEYKVILDPEVAKSTGLELRGDRVFTAHSEAFRVERVALFVEPVAGAPRTYVVKGTVSFNLPIDPRAFADHLQLDLERRGRVEVVLETEGSSRDLSFRGGPLVADEKDEKVTARIAGELRAAPGETPLGDDVTASAVLPSFRRLAITRVTPGLEAGKLVVTIQLSSAVDPGELEARLELEPEVENLRLDARGTTLFLHGDWQYSRRYSIAVHGDLASREGMQLERDYRGSIFFEDLPPSVEIAGRGSYLSLRGDRKIGVETVNVERLALELDRVHANNLVPFLQSGGLAARSSGRFSLANQGVALQRREIDVASAERNRPVLTPIDLGEEIRESSRGIFRLTVRDPDQPRLSSSRFLVATDLGIVAKRSSGGIIAAVVSIAELAPVPGALVRILSRSNQELASARSDANGFVAFEDLEPDDSRMDPGGYPFVVTAARGDDLGFLSFEDTHVPTADFDVGGLETPKAGTRIFVYSDRGIYRPGDRVRLAWIARGADLRIPPEFPLTLSVVAPDGRIFEERLVTTGANGVAEQDLEIPDWAPTGEYRARLLLDPETALGDHALQVEDFIPDRMKVALTLLVHGEEKGLAAPGDELSLEVEARTLFGPPAAGRDARARVRFVHAQVEIPEWKGWTFGDLDEKVAARDVPLGAKKTDEEGRAAWTVQVPETPGYHGWLRGEAEVEVEELGGGRAIGGRRSLLVSPVTHVLGLRRSRDAAGAPPSESEEPGRPISFDAVLLDLAGHPLASTAATMTVFRREWRTILEKDERERYRYASVLDEQEIETRSLALPEVPSSFRITLERHGTYRLIVEDRERGARTSLVFHVYGSGYAPWAMSAPEKVTIRLDRETYSPGDVAKAQIEAPFPGLMLLTVERERVFTRKWVRLQSNSAVVQIPVETRFQPNSYVVATLLRPLDSVERHAPARAFGAAPLFLDREPATLAVELEAPDAMRPRGKLPVRLRVPNADRRTAVTVAAVDEGILQITAFETPSPLEFFLGRRRLAVDSHDVWSLLLPEYRRVAARSSPGGDVTELPATLRQRNLN